ncbi:hypothetical protein PHYSODRAFT_295591 [Phytophthora sojae]|uniref:Uncharacterized protein n=1 Tax=Phytophthora sojae (strain P6497) TaxID=1094619 RepID=G4YTA3_PHYSP|nr:hypothetical protein PHYSODRAFT_295591 [Phytophthora sojae]EGZ23025.1 hypothetical protein PHYSODRAFT_295591 [Phytophthora sojae]|eukprot:XP_009518313.1 hypothetical protein PHYSODRAFT_295591 [Phytophthora sojae]
MFGSGADAAVQQPTLTWPRVVSCRYFCFHCGGDTCSIFQQEYYRSLELGGVQSLQGFPHCCPERYSVGSNCSSSLHLLVTFSGDATALRQSDELAVCCRFEPVASESGPYGSSLTVGEMVLMPTADPSSPLPSANWFVGKQESENNQRKFPKSAIVYVFNDYHHQQGKWRLMEDESALGPRVMRDQLVVYVLQPRSRSYVGQFQGERLIYRAPGVLSTVIYRSPSPPFKILPCSSLRNQVQHSAMDSSCQSKRRRSSQGIEHFRLETTGVPSGWSTASLSPANEPGSPREYAWQLNRHVSELSFSDKMLHLAIPLLFLEFTPLCAVGSCFDHHDDGLSSQREGGSASAARMTLWSNVQHVVSEAFNSSDEWFLPEDRSVVQESIHLLLDVLTSSSIRQLISSTFTTTPELDSAVAGLVEIPTKQQFQERFYDFVGNLYEAMVMLRSHENEDLSLRIAELSSKLLRVIYERAPFRPLQKLISEMLLNRSLVPVTLALQTFTAQLREMYVTYWKKLTDQRSRVYAFPVSLSGLVNQEGISYLHSWNGRWVMDAETTRVVPYDNAASGGVLIWMLCIQQLATVDIQISSPLHDGGGYKESCFLAIDTAPLESTDISTTTPPDGMHLVLDGRFRVFRTLPNGISSLAASLAGRWDIGDYVGSFLSDAHDGFELQFFALGHGSVGSGSQNTGKSTAHAPPQCISVYRLELTLVIGDERLPGQTQRKLKVQGNISVAALSTDRRTLADMSSSARGAKLTALYWVPVMALHSRYTCKPAEIEYIVSL